MKATKSFEKPVSDNTSILKNLFNFDVDETS